MRLIVVATIALSGTVYYASQGDTDASHEVPAPVVTLATVPTSTTSTTTTTTTTVPAYEPPDDARCPQWWETALQVLPESDMARWDYVIWRESRCLDDAFNASDPNGGSIGLVQINRFWCLPSRYFPEGWLQTQGVLSSCDDLYDPVINFTAARAIFEYADERGCGWSPWSTRRTRWC